jgi:surface antigen
MQQQIVQLRHQTLENVPSGTKASWVAPAGDARVDVIPVQTYRTPDNRYCREYEERIEDAQGVEIRRGIACRAGKAFWSDQAMPGLSGTTL